jgi:GNAT superfamily N-acetyltransferase
MDDPGSRTPRALLARFCGSPPAPALRIERAGRREYDRLAPLHYRAGPPATIDRVLAAYDEQADLLAGVLVVSFPTLNGAWRAAAFPGAFDTGDKVRAARQRNDRLRCISRVIVDPRCRGLGVASGLVRAYLAEPCTPLTEAVTAMGACCPFFERGGMRRVSWTSSRDLALRRAIGVEGGRGVESALRGADERALRAWAKAGPATRGLHDPQQIRLAALGALLAPPLAYAAGT